MIVDSHPPVPTSAVFDPATLMRNKPQHGNSAGMTAAQQQQARQRYWSGIALGRPSSVQDAVVGGVGASKASNKAAPQQQWAIPAEKEIYTPFKSVSGRVTPLDDPYSPNNRALSTAGNEYMPAPQDPRERPPSRATSVQGAMFGAGGGYHRRLERKSEGSVVYQPLTPTNHASAWSNSLMFNKPQGLDPFDQAADSPLGASAAVPPLPHIQTLPRQLPLARHNHNSNGFGTPPEEPTHNNRQQIPQQPFAAMNGYIPMGGPSDMYQFQKSDQTKSANGNRVTVKPNGTIIGTPSSLSSADVASGDLTTGVNQEDGDGNAKKSRRSRRQRNSFTDQSENAALEKLPIVEKTAIMHILLGMSLFGLGIARLLLLSTWGLGIELVYGVYVVLTGILGVIGCRRRHYCSLVACFAMSTLACVLAIPPFVTGLLVTVPDSFRTVDPTWYKSAQEPYGVDIALAVICLVELVMSIITSGLGCSVAGSVLTKWRQIEEAEEKHGLQNMGIGGVSKNSANQAPIFHTSVNITHPGMMK